MASESSFNDQLYTQENKRYNLFKKASEKHVNRILKATKINKSAKKEKSLPSSEYLKTCEKELQTILQSSLTDAIEKIDKEANLYESLLNLQSAPRFKGKAWRPSGDPTVDLIDKDAKVYENYCTRSKKVIKNLKSEIEELETELAEVQKTVGVKYENSLKKIASYNEN